MEQPPADDTHQPTPHVLLCSLWAPFSLAAPLPVPPGQAVTTSPNQAPEGRIPLCPFPAQPWQQVVTRPTKNSQCPGEHTPVGRRAGATLRPQVCIGCNKAEWEPRELRWFFHQGQGRRM